MILYAIDSKKVGRRKKEEEENLFNCISYRYKKKVERRRDEEGEGGSKSPCSGNHS